MMKLGFIGAGKVAQAMVKGLIYSNKLYAKNIIASAPKTKFDSHFLDHIGKNGIRTTHSNAEVVKSSDVIILAVKPNVMPTILPEIAPNVSHKHLIVSFALGVTLGNIEKTLPMHSRVIRVMPNIAMNIGKGTSVYCLGNSVRPGDAKLVSSLMNTVGAVEELQDESLMDCVTALSGSGPAYSFMFLESLVDGAVMMGMSRAQATRLAANTLIGAAKMCLKSNALNEYGGGLGALKSDVCSPGGCTARSVYVLEKMGFRAAVIAAIEASTLRSKEIYQESMASSAWGLSTKPYSLANEEDESNRVRHASNTLLEEETETAFVDEDDQNLNERSDNNVHKKQQFLRINESQELLEEPIIVKNLEKHPSFYEMDVIFNKKRIDKDSLGFKNLLNNDGGDNAKN